MSACASAQPTPATGVTAGGATLNAVLSSDRDETVTSWFEYGKTIAYGASTPHRTTQITDRAQHPMSEAVTGLDPDSRYHFTFCAQTPSFKTCGTDQSFTTGQGVPTVLSIAATPELSPQFDQQVSDYVTRCGTDPVSVAVAAPPGTQVAVDGQPSQSGRFTRTVQLAPGQGFDIVVDDGTPRAFHVRCLPSDFPDWTFTRSSAPTQAFTLLAVSKTGRYVAFFDSAGVPVWWYGVATTAIDAKLLSDDTVAYARGPGGPFGTADTAYEIRRLDGSLVRTVTAVGSDTDHHDLQEVGTDDLLVLSYRRRDHVDLSAHGGPADATVLDAVIEELDPDGAVVWSWNSKDHVALGETGPWWSTVLAQPARLGDGTTAYDIVHVNAVEPDGDGLIVSMRHTNGVYRIDRADGHVDWKLGGTSTPQSLTVSSDAGSPPLSGQHDARRLGDGTVSVHDNGTGAGRPPRALRFRIDATARTATLTEKLTDAEITGSACCGSARKLDSGGWLMGWGAISSPTVAEYAADGTRVFKLSFPGAFAYRAVPVPRGRITAAQLRQAMDTMHPR